MADTLLCEIARKFCTDKVTNGYTPHYHNAFGLIRKNITRVLEIGVKEGASLLTWEEYFPMADIYGVDKLPWLVDKSMGRIKVLIADQSDKNDLSRLVAAITDGVPPIIIDDGSHMQHDQQITFEKLFPLMPRGGFYIIEDLLTEYNRKFGDGWGSDPKNNGKDLTLYALEEYKRGVCQTIPFFHAMVEPMTIQSVDIYYTTDFPRRPWNGQEPKCSANWPGAVTAIIRKA